MSVYRTPTTALVVVVLHASSIHLLILYILLDGDTVPATCIKNKTIWYLIRIKATVVPASHGM